MQKAIWERGAIRMNRLVKLNQTSQHYIWEKAAFRTKQFIKLIWLSNVTFVREIAIKGPFRSVCLIIPSGLRLKEWSVVGLQWTTVMLLKTVVQLVMLQLASAVNSGRMFIFSTHFNYHSEIWTSNSHILT